MIPQRGNGPCPPLQAPNTKRIVTTSPSRTSPRRRIRLSASGIGWMRAHTRKVDLFLFSMEGKRAERTGQSCFDVGAKARDANKAHRLPFLEKGILQILSNATGGLAIVLEHR